MSHAHSILKMLLVLLAISSCRGGGQANDVLERYAEALESNRFKEAYDLMDNDYREAHSFETFLAGLEEAVDTPREVAAKIRNSKKREIRGAMSLKGGDSIPMIYEDGAWKIVGNPVDFYDHSSPRSSLRAFVMASEMKRWDMLLLLSPENYRDKMTALDIKSHFEGVNKAFIEQMIVELKDGIGNDIKDYGDKAEMNYGDARLFRFVKEGEEWKVLDPD